MRDAGEGNGTSMTLLLDDHIGVHNKQYCGDRVNYVDAVHSSGSIMGLAGVWAFSGPSESSANTSLG